MSGNATAPAAPAAPTAPATPAPAAAPAAPATAPAPAPAPAPSTPDAAPSTPAAASPAPTAPADAPAAAAPAADPSLLGDGAAPDAPAEAPPAAPEPPVEYKPFEMPEGMAVDEGALGAFREVAAGMRLPQEQAQQLVSLYAQQVQAQASAAREALSRRAAEEVAAVRADRELGADLPGTLTNAARAMDRFAGQDAAAFRALLRERGVDNHPLMVRVLARAGAALGEAPFVRADTTPAPSKGFGERMYPPKA